MQEEQKHQFVEYFNRWAKVVNTKEGCIKKIKQLQFELGCQQEENRLIRDHSYEVLNNRKKCVNQ